MNNHKVPNASNNQLVKGNFIRNCNVKLIYRNYNLTFPDE